MQSLQRLAHCVEVEMSARKPKAWCLFDTVYSNNVACTADEFKAWHSSRVSNVRKLIAAATSASAELKALRRVVKAAQAWERATITEVDSACRELSAAVQSILKRKGRK